MPHHFTLKLVLSRGVVVWPSSSWFPSLPSSSSPSSSSFPLTSSASFPRSSSSFPLPFSVSCGPSLLASFPLPLLSNPARCRLLLSSLSLSVLSNPSRCCRTRLAVVESNPSGCYRTLAALSNPSGRHRALSPLSKPIFAVSGCCCGFRMCWVVLVVPVDIFVSPSVDALVVAFAVASGI